MATALLVGTRKGLFILHADDARRSFELEGPLLPGWSVNHAIVDPRDGVLYTCTNNPVYGGTVHRSADRGQSWERAETLGLPEESGLKLASTWHVEPGLAAAPGTLWLGGEPGVLFRSNDGGATWEVNRPLLEHSTRDRWHPGAGGLICHSITLDPLEAERLWIGISAAGVFRTDDGGESWERLDGNGLPSGFGFGLALDPADPDAAWVIPEIGPENRVTPDGRLGVYHTHDAGSSWQLITVAEPSWAAVLRQAMAYDEAGVYFGTQSGFVYSLAGGEVVEAARHLPPVLSVAAGAWH